jgi:CheY-like chemotaxis protein
MFEDRAPTLVVVEDDPGHARLLERNLRRAHWPYPIILLRDGQAALDYLLPPQEGPGTRQPSQPTLVLLDLNLPGCPGVEVLARLKREARTKHIPVIILTTTVERHEIEACYALGCNAYFTKPVDYDQFIELIHKLAWWLSGVEVPRGAAAGMSQEPSEDAL